VRLGLPGGVLMVGEGIETCLAAMRATGRVAWAALSTSGLRKIEWSR
jgi:putative DNA primase/helicase